MSPIMMGREQMFSRADGQNWSLSSGLSVEFFHNKYLPKKQLKPNYFAVCFNDVGQTLTLPALYTVLNNAYVSACNFSSKKKKRNFFQVYFPLFLLKKKKRN